LCSFEHSQQPARHCAFNKTMNYPEPNSEHRNFTVAFVLIMLMLVILVYSIARDAGRSGAQPSGSRIVAAVAAVPASISAGSRTVVVPTAAAPAATPPFRRCPRATIAYRAHGDLSHMTACRSIAPATPTPNR
jgi:hypothetical protein